MASVLMRTAQPYCKCRQGLIKIRGAPKEVEVKNFSTKEAVATSENPNEVTVKLSSGNNLWLNSGKLAKLADGCASVTYKSTTVVATVVSKNNSKSEESFVPLTVSYHQKAAALGRIPVNFLRREHSQSETEILTSRMIDRSVRPLFPQGFNWDTQITCSPLAMDGSNFPDVLGINAASAALAVSGVPWEGPLGAVRVGLVDGKCVINPSKQELSSSPLSLVVAGRNFKSVTMIEGVSANVIQSDLFKCLKAGVKECEKIATGIAKLQKAVGKPKRTFENSSVNPEIQADVESLASDELKKIFQDFSHHKLSRDEAVMTLREEVVAKVKEKFPEASPKSIYNSFNSACKKVFRDLIFETEIRCDGRGLKEMRKISCEVDLYEPLHGSALFQRGQTQVLCTVALDSPNSALRMDKIAMLTSGVKEKNFFVHYEFPPFATNETGRMGPIGRREIGHGILAEKALKSNIPEDFPFTVRLTSEVLESNGSSSMATVCGGTLALLDAGVPLINPCAGVAMGCISRVNEASKITEYKILTDLLGIEDYFGEMDFKVAGTKKAYTAFQMDIKNSGVPLMLLFEILSEAKEAISGILNIMKSVCPEARTERKSNWPEKSMVKVPVHLRPQFLGPGGVNIKKLEMSTGVELTETVVGEFSLFAPNADAMKEAKEIIAKLLRDTADFTLEFGGVYSALITEIRDSGCMVTLYPNMKPAYVPLSQLDIRPASHPSALGMEVGQEIKVKFFGRDPVTGSLRLSRKVLLGPASEVARQLHKTRTPVEEPQTQKQTSSEDKGR